MTLLTLVCPIATTFPAVLAVNPTPSVNSVTDQTVCNGANTSLITFGGTGTSYNWSNNNTTIGLGASGTGYIPVFAASNSGTAPVTATITVTPVYTAGGTLVMEHLYHSLLRSILRHCRLR
jgi:hypothetical protein